MNTYLLTSKSGKLKLSFTYNLNGFLIGFKAEPDEISEKSLTWIYKHMPHHEHNIEKFKKVEGLQIKKVPADLSFENFYNTFGYKVGNKKRCNKLWDALDDADKVLCLLSIPKYKAYLNLKGHANLYPETYLSQRRWENEFK
jgi:hypothetical protein